MASCGLIVAAFVLTAPVISLAATVISQGYQSSEPLSVGSIVSLDKDASNSIKASKIDNVDSLFGVVVSANSTLLALTSEQKNQVQVASSGVVQTIVSDINGKVRAGDLITASPMSGVGMKATSNTRVVGSAQADLANSSGKSTQSYTDQSGQKVQAELGVIPVLINVSYYFKEPEKTVIPTLIQNVANTIAGKKVSPLPIIISLVIALVGMAGTISLIYSAIRSSIISVGRNPLAQSAVYRSLLQVIALTTGVIAIALGAIYLILSRLP